MPPAFLGDRLGIAASRQTLLLSITLAKEFNIRGIFLSGVR